MGYWTMGYVSLRLCVAVIIDRELAKRRIFRRFLSL